MEAEGKEREAHVWTPSWGHVVVVIAEHERATDIQKEWDKNMRERERERERTHVCMSSC